MPPTSGNEPVHLVARLETLDASKLNLLSRMIDAMAGTAAFQPPLAGDSDLATQPFIDTFTDFLLLHHGIYEGQRLNKEAFEFLFGAANQSAGRSAVRNLLRGSSTHDIRINGVRWSLKTEAGGSQTPDVVKIEKWMEARWIRDCLNPASCAKAMDRVIDHMADFERIAVLKASTAKNSTLVRYQLLELPKAKLLMIGGLPHQAFTKEGNKMSYGANLVDADGTRILRLLLDSSVEKVRIWYRIAHAISHGTWTIAIPSG